MEYFESKFSGNEVESRLEQVILNKNKLNKLSDDKVNKTDIATINGQSLINGGNIVIEGGLVDTPIVYGDAENSAVLAGEYEGYKNQAISQTSIAVGAGTIAGLKGWYYTHVNVDEKKIFLGTERTKILGVDSLTCTYKKLIVDYSDSKYTDTSFVSGYEVGDVLSIVYDDKHEDYATIIAISGNVITLDKIPFESGDFTAGVCTKVSAVGQPDEFSVYCIKRDFNDTTKVLTLSKYDNGGVDFGGGTLSEGIQTYAVNIGAHAEGCQTVAKGQYSHAEGLRTIANYAAHAEGDKTQALGKRSHAEGYNTLASGTNSHAEGRNNTVDSSRGHVEGENNYVGDTDRETPSATNTTNNGFASHAEGQANTAIGNSSHVEGLKNKVLGRASHSEGQETVAEGNVSHAEGYQTHAKGGASHTSGYGTVATNENEFACGRFNISTQSDSLDKATLFSIGSGTRTNPKNVHEITKDGKHYILGVGNYDGTNPTSTNDLVSYLTKLENRIKELEDIISQNNN